MREGTGAGENALAMGGSPSDRLQIIESDGADKRTQHIECPRLTAACARLDSWMTDRAVTALHKSREEVQDEKTCSPCEKALVLLRLRLILVWGRLHFSANSARTTSTISSHFSSRIFSRFLAASLRPASSLDMLAYWSVHLACKADDRSRQSR